MCVGGWVGVGVCGACVCKVCMCVGGCACVRPM